MTNDEAYSAVMDTYRQSGLKAAWKHWEELYDAEVTNAPEDAPTPFLGLLQAAAKLRAVGREIAETN